MEKISEIKTMLEMTPLNELLEKIKQYESDEREGVKKLVVRARKRLEYYEKELLRTEQMKQYEKEYGEYSYICGIDEVGRGPLAGPVVAAAVILPKDCNILYINDSKQLSEAKREELYEQIMEQAISVGIGIVSEERIDEINILQATYEAMREAVGKLNITPDLLLNDAVTIPNLSMKQVPIIKGDAKSISIAAASIIAKVTRDRMMIEWDNIYPAYGFSKNKGYGSKEHTQALKEIGPCKLHRKTFIKSYIK